jgi:hypothetical protein
MEISEQTSTKLVIRDFPSLWYVLMLVPYLLLGIFPFLFVGLSFVLANANSFFSAFILGAICITPILMWLA